MPDPGDFMRYVRDVVARNGLGSLQAVVAKELLHYEIFGALAGEGLLSTLAFQGGTCLRLSNGSSRDSEDLDFVVDLASRLAR